MSEDDWETADLSSVAASKAKSKPSLRAGAASFQPQPRSTPFLPTEAGPSRPSTTSYIARPPIHQGSDTSDDWFRGPKPASNRQIWDAANTHLPSPLPTLATTPGLNIASPIPQPGITILRRQPGSEAKKRGGGTQTPPKTIEEREEEYRLARERIFGGTGTATGSGNGVSLGKAGPAEEGGTGRNKSSGGRSRTPNQNHSDRKDVERAVSPNIARLWDDAGLQTGIGPVPVQVRRSPAPGVIRQPIGPGSGGGFGRQEQ